MHRRPASHALLASRSKAPLSSLDTVAGCHGRPVAVKVFPGNTADPTAFTTITADLRTKFNLDQLVMVGDRGMITTARIEALKEVGGYGWVTALRAPQIAALAADDGPLQLSLFDQANLAEITHPDYPGERLIACRNPALAEQRTRKRDALLQATDTDLNKIVASVAAGRLHGADKIGLRVGKTIGRHKMAKHYQLHITDTGFSYTHHSESITAEAALDGIYIVRTTLTPEQAHAAQIVATYKNLSRVERDFRSLKTIDLHLRLQMTERVLVRHDPATGAVTAAHHAPEPGLRDPRDKPERWRLDLLHPDGERQTLGEFDGPALPRAQAYLQALGINPRQA